MNTRDLTPADAVAADPRLMDQIIAENDEGLREIARRDRDSELRTEIENLCGDPRWSGATRLKVPGCECVAEKRGRWVLVEECEAHRVPE